MFVSKCQQTYLSRHPNNQLLVSYKFAVCCRHSRAENKRAKNAPAAAVCHDPHHRVLRCLVFIQQTTAPYFGAGSLLICNELLPCANKSFT